MMMGEPRTHIVEEQIHCLPPPESYHSDGMANTAESTPTAEDGSAMGDDSAGMSQADANGMPQEVLLYK